jgi:hypothetical protein
MQRKQIVKSYLPCPRYSVFRTAYCMLAGHIRNLTPLQDLVKRPFGPNSLPNWLCLYLTGEGRWTDGVLRSVPVPLHLPAAVVHCVSTAPAYQVGRRVSSKCSLLVVLRTNWTSLTARTQHIHYVVSMAQAAPHFCRRLRPLDPEVGLFQ